MYFFIKKTGELVKRKNVPCRKSDLEKKNGLYIRILLGPRKDKAFFVYKNQLQVVQESTLLTPYEIECMKRAHKNPEEWKTLCAVIKSSRKNNYPKDWFAVLRKEKIEREVQDKKEASVNIFNMMSGLFKSLGQPAAEEQGSPSMPTIIVLETEPESFGKKKGTKEKVAEKMHDVIQFHSTVEGTDDILNSIDFVTRYDLSSHKSVNIVPPIGEKDIIVLSDPFPNLQVPVGKSFSNTRDLIVWLLERVKHFSFAITGNTILEDIGILQMRKIDSSTFIVDFLT
jgi:hypothetical protein